MPTPSSTLRVCCAIIEHDDKVLCAQRSARMNLPLKWEFPGGKIEADETAEGCLLRECREELNIDVGIVKQLASAVHPLGEGRFIELIPFICVLRGGTLEVREHAAIKWLSLHQLPDLDWAAADVDVVHDYMRLKGFSGKEANRQDSQTLT